MATTNDFRNGLCIEWNDDLWQIVSFQHVKPGKGAAFVRTKLKSITTGKVLENTFAANEKISTARIEKRLYQYLYKDETGYHFMNEETFNQINLQEDQIESPDLLKEGNRVEITFHDETETPLSVSLPQFIELEITYTEPGVKGDTATNTLKRAELETGAGIAVPLFVNTGDIIKIDNKKREYIERIKK